MSETLIDTSGRPAAGEDPLKRQQILEGARKVFVSVGFDAASMNDVTRAAGVSKSTLYVYYRSKEELFTALICEERERYIVEIQKILDDPTRPAETLHRYGRKLAFKVTSTATVKANRTVIAVAERMPELGRDFFERGPERGTRLLMDYFAAAQEAGTLAIENFRLAAVQFVELSTAGLLRPRLFAHVTDEPTAEEIEMTVDGAVRLFMTSYGTQKAPCGTAVPFRHENL